MSDEPAPRRFAALPEDTIWFRLATRGSAYLPKDNVLPDPLWLNPTSEDISEGADRGREPGLSVWDRARTSVRQGQLLANKNDGEAFGMLVSTCLAVGGRHGRCLALVRDPLEDQQSQTGWDGHALLEGLQRKTGEAKLLLRDLRSELVENLRRLED